jgi:hypothetical protein
MKAATEFIRGLTGFLSVVAFISLYLWTNALAKVQESGPQLLQVYTRASFYGIFIIGLAFGIYIFTRASD